jgi:hypothetical protein
LWGAGAALSLFHAMSWVDAANASVRKKIACRFDTLKNQNNQKKLRK